MRKAKAWLVFLAVLGLVGGLTAEGEANAGLLGRLSQLVNLGIYPSAGSSTYSSFIQRLPNGEIVPITFSENKTFVMTWLSAQFTPASTETYAPYRLIFKINGNFIFGRTLDESGTFNMYKTGAVTLELTPGIVMSETPTIEIRTYGMPPGDHNDGELVPGRLNITILGYMLP